LSPDTDLLAYRRFTTRTRWHTVSWTGVDLVIKNNQKWDMTECKKEKKKRKKGERKNFVSANLCPAEISILGAGLDSDLKTGGIMD
jgi:hypothetical protein